MSSVGQVAGGIVGGVIGFVVGGPAGAMKGAQLGMAVGSMIDPPKGPTINGPRLSDLTVQTSTYGAQIPRVYGTITQAGNIFWLKGNALTETAKSEEGGKGGPESTTNTWEYSATFALGLCEGPIDGVRRIWIGGQLWYDAGSDDINAVIASNEAASRFTLYSGNNTQLPDPSIQADKGVANTPAYRGLAYIVFDNLPLEKYGNSLANTQVKVEIVSEATVLGPRYLDTLTVAGYPSIYYCRPVQTEKDGVMELYGYNPSAGIVALPSGETIANDERLLKLDYAGNYLGQRAVPPDDPSYQTVRPQFSSSGTKTTRLGSLGGRWVWWPEHSSNKAIQNGTHEVLPYGNLTGRDTAAVFGDAGDIADYLTGEAGRYVAGLAITKDGSKILVTTSAAPRTGVFTANRYFVLDASLSILRSGTISGGGGATSIWNIGTNTSENPNGGTVFDDGEGKGWTVGLEYGNTLSAYFFSIDNSGAMQVNSVIAASAVGAAYFALAYSGGLLYVVSRIASGARLYRLTDFPTITSGMITLASIVQAECLTSRLISSADINVTALQTDTVRGYKVAQLGAIRSSIEQLRAAFQFDAVQSGYKIKFVKRGAGSVATIPVADLGNAENGVQLTGSRDMSMLLPKKVSVKYLDVGREYDTGEQIASRGL